MSGSDLMGLGLGAALVSVVALKSRTCLYVRLFIKTCSYPWSVAPSISSSTSRLLLVVVLKIRVLYHHQDINAFGLILANRVSVSMVLTFKINFEQCTEVGFPLRRLVPSLTPTISPADIDLTFEFDEDEGLCSSLTLPSTSVTGTSVLILVVVDLTIEGVSSRGCRLRRLFRFRLGFAL
ncbi:hypothetical protein BDZ89DRAFT_1132843 [Hymenopellis radicata]|nr:hypothetical protein BDZ89DRAFT_1132843 [Hymenopellis radicata]